MAKKQRRKSTKTAAVKADFHAALDRLLAGKPKSKDLKAQAALGKLKLTKANLAKEAGRSVVVIYRDQYADVRERFESLKSPKSSCKVAPTIGAIRELRAACSQQIDNAKQLWVDTTELHSKLAEQEVQIERFRRDMERLARDAHSLRAENAKLKEQIHGTNVMAFPTPESSRQEP